MFDGDSLTVGTGSTAGNDYPTVVMSSLGSLTTDYAWKVAVGGQTLAAMLVDVTVEIDRAYHAGATNYVAFWGGTNDIRAGDTAANVLANLATYGGGRQTTGFKTIVLDILPSQAAGNPPDFDTKRTAVNDQLRIDFDGVTSDAVCFTPAVGVTYADMLVDVAAISELSDPTNTTYYNADKVHLTNAGYALVAAKVKAAIDLLA